MCGECTVVHRGVAEVCIRVQKGAWKCRERCTEVCASAQKGVWKYAEGCISVQRYAHTCTEVPEGCTWVCYHWLLLVTIHLVGDNRKFEV